MRTLFTLALTSMLICLASLTAHAQGSTKKRVVPPPLPFGQTGPLPQVPLDQMPPVSPQVNFRNGELTIVAPNSTLSDILHCVRDQTGAEIEIPATNDRVVTRLGPGPVRDILAELLNGSHFNYALLGSPTERNSLTKVVLLAKTGPDVAAPNEPGTPKKVVPAALSTRTNPDEGRKSSPQGFANQEDVPSNQEIIAPPPASDGAVEMTD